MRETSPAARIVENTAVQDVPRYARPPMAAMISPPDIPIRKFPHGSYSISSGGGLAGIHSLYSTGGSLLLRFSLMTRRLMPRSFAYGLPIASTCISVALRISLTEPFVLSLCSLVKITAAPSSAAIAARSAFMPTESASRSSTTFPAPKKSGSPYPEKCARDSTRPDPAGGMSGSARRHSIPRFLAIARFDGSPAFPGTTTAATPAKATASPTRGMFSS
ncbi:MAG: hypothetical protein A4E42_01738 [Methanoregulaceae archaeon PtaU1.Bin222]|nr:MAG: hypothetical protein A4E42_01738 [Methanoregulaceae archaeon PtaU1.Bin222]